MKNSNILLAASIAMLLAAVLVYAGVVNAIPSDQAAFDGMQGECR